MALPNLAQRLISAVVALPLVAALILWNEPWGFGALMLVIAAIGLREYGAIALAGADVRLRVGVIVLGVGLAAGLYALPAYAVVWVLAAFVGTSALVLFDPGEIPAAGRPAGDRGVRRLLPGAAVRADGDPAARRAARAGLGDAGDRADVQQRHGRLLRRPRPRPPQALPRRLARQDRRGRRRRHAGRAARHAGRARDVRSLADHRGLPARGAAGRRHRSDRATWSSP